MRPNGRYAYVRDILRGGRRIGQIRFTEPNDGQPVAGPGPIVFDDCQPGGPYPLYVHLGERKIIKRKDASHALRIGKIILVHSEQEAVHHALLNAILKSLVTP